MCVCVCVFQDIPFLAVSGFIFLRFFAPAILSPKLFALYDVHPNRKIHRTLTIMAKVRVTAGAEQWRAFAAAAMPLPVSSTSSSSLPA